ncbi:HAD family hydrolase [Thermoactinomyces vulgaris]|nr:HAD family hydrolase [Thermoactinomyces vulgaris]
MTMNEAWRKVKAFHQAYSVPVSDQPGKLSEERVAKRKKWMEEELDEFAKASTIEDQADAMIDTIYLALGTLVEMGVKPEAVFQIVHEANMSKLWPDGKPRYRETDGKVIKPPGWKDPQPRIREVIRKQKMETANGPANEPTGVLHED